MHLTQAVLLVAGVVGQGLCSLAGEARALIYPHQQGKVVAVVGQGWAPVRRLLRS